MVLVGRPFCVLLCIKFAGLFCGFGLVWLVWFGLIGLVDLITLPKTNKAAENGWLEDEISYWEGLFPGDMLVSGGYIKKYVFFSFALSLARSLACSRACVRAAEIHWYMWVSLPCHTSSRLEESPDRRDRLPLAASKSRPLGSTSRHHNIIAFIQAVAACP